VAVEIVVEIPAGRGADGAALAADEEAVPRDVLIRAPVVTADARVAAVLVDKLEGIAGLLAVAL
jgi:hypothetical protein